MYWRTQMTIKQRAKNGTIRTERRNREHERKQHRSVRRHGRNKRKNRQENHENTSLKHDLAKHVLHARMRTTEPDIRYIPKNYSPIPTQNLAKLE